MTYVSVEVDVDDVIDQIDDKRLLREVSSRQLDGVPDVRALVQRALVAIKSGRVNDGVTMLEREFFPTWKSKADCEAAYRTAMALKGMAA